MNISCKNLKISVIICTCNIDKITFTGKLSRDLLISYYAKALCVVFASIDEPFGIVPIESQAAFTPVIATKSGGSLEMVNEGKTGFLIEPNSLDELAERVQYLSQNRDVVEIMGIAGRKFVENNFSWDVATERLFDVFQKFCGSKS
ncbi:glycosyltransferase [Methanospirillum sp.]